MSTPSRDHAIPAHLDEALAPDGTDRPHAAAVMAAVRRLVKR